MSMRVRSRFTDSEALTGTGPYKLKSYDKAQGSYPYEANEDYYQGSPDKGDKVC